MKKLLLTLSVMFVTVLAPIAVPTITAAAACPGPGSAKGQVLEGVGQTGSDCSSTGVSKTIEVAIQIISLVAGITAIIMVILAGFKYITSGGDAGKVGTAKNTLIYALVGVAIAAIAQILVHFVINTAIDSSTPCTISGKTGLTASDPKCK